MSDLQVWLVSSLAGVAPVASLMRTRWAWPICESLHFIGLSLLIGMIGAFDLRLLGVAKRIPIAALHRLVPWGILWRNGTPVARTGEATPNYATKVRPRCPTTAHKLQGPARGCQSRRNGRRGPDSFMRCWAAAARGQVSHGS